MTLGYYPFGLKQKGYNDVVTGGNDLAQNWKYNGKELNQELGLNWYDYEARNYDVTLGRWMNIDPLAEKYYDKSSYSYSLNNPIFFIDPDGRTVDVSDLVKGGTKTDTFLLIQLMANLSETTGSVISVSTNNMGESILQQGECKSNCKSSSSASDYVSNLINDSSGVLKVMNEDRNTTKSKGSGSHAYPDGRIYLDANQINSIQKSLGGSGIEERTMDTGFVFIHEALHTRFGASFFNSPLDNSEKEGGRFRDPKGSFAKSFFAGPTVNRVNAFREEIGLPTRLTYSNWNPKSPGSLVFLKDGNKVEVPIKYYNIE